MRNKLMFGYITSIFALALVLGSVSALSGVPNLEAYKHGSVQYLPSKGLNGKSYFSVNSMVGYLTINAKDNCGKPFQMQLNINNDNVYRSGSDLVVKGVAYGVWWTNDEIVSIDWVEGKYVIHSNGKIDVYVNGNLVVKDLVIQV